MHSILVVENQVSLAQKLATTLESRGLYVVLCHFLKSAFDQLDKQNFDISIINRSLPDGEGIHLTEFIAQTWYQTKILMIGEQASTKEKILGLQKGADDYLGKPFDLLELAWRIERLRYRRKLLPQACLKLSDSVKLFPDEGIFYCAHQKQILRKKEAQLLSCLMMHQNRVVTREMLIQWVWGATAMTPKDITLDVYIMRLRLILGCYAKQLETIRGFGYRLNSL